MEPFVSTDHSQQVSQVEKHPYFDLWLHPTAALEQVLGARVTKRETIHEWPLSTVQRLTYGDGQIIIYKCQHHATVEPEFYRCARSDLLPAFRSLGKVNGCDVMLIEHIAGRRVAECEMSTDQVVALGRRLSTEIGQIGGDLPVYTDIGTTANWRMFVEKTLGDLDRLITSGVFPSVNAQWVSALAHWAEEAQVLRTIEEQAAFTHGDLNGGNIFIVGDGLKLIDWQRPKRAPRDTDLAGLLHWRGIDMYQHVQREVGRIYQFLLVSWFVECQTTLFPAGNYDGMTRDWIASILAH